MFWWSINLLECSRKRNRSSSKLFYAFVLGNILYANAFSPSGLLSRPLTRTAPPLTKVFYKKGGTGFSSRKDWDQDYEEEFEVKRNKVGGFSGFSGNQQISETSRQRRRRETYADRQIPAKAKQQAKKKNKGNWARERDQTAGREVSVKAGDNAHKQRLAKVLAHAGVSSRRVAETFISDGRLRVNGKMVTAPGTVVDPQRDIIHLDGKRIALRTDQEIKWVMLHKPKGVLTTLEDEKGRQCVADLVPRARTLHMVPVGRLDRDSTGLLLLTNDLSYVHVLTHPSFEHWKTYRVKVTGQLEDSSWKQFETGLMLKGEKRKTAPCYLEPIEYNPATKLTTVDVSLREGRNRQIRRMFDHLGHEVKSLKRTSFGPLKLSSLAEGDYRELKTVEVEKLRELANKSSTNKKDPKQPAANKKKKVKEMKSSDKPKNSFDDIVLPDDGLDFYSQDFEPEKQWNKNLLNV